MEGSGRVTDAASADLWNLCQLHLSRVQTCQRYVRSAVDSAECDWIDITQNWMELIDDGDVGVQDSVIHGEVNLVPHRYVHSERQSVWLVLVAVRT